MSLSAQLCSVEGKKIIATQHTMITEFNIYMETKKIDKLNGIGFADIYAFCMWLLSLRSSLINLYDFVCSFQKKVFYCR